MVFTAIPNAILANTMPTQQNIGKSKEIFFYRKLTIRRFFQFKTVIQKSEKKKRKALYKVWIK